MGTVGDRWIAVRSALEDIAGATAGFCGASTVTGEGRGLGHEADASRHRCASKVEPGRFQHAAGVSERRRIGSWLNAART